MMTLSSNLMIHRDWLTAKVADPSIVRRCLGRLEASGYEYRVVFDERQLRVVVRRVDLDEVLELLADLSSGGSRKRAASPSDYRLSIRLLAAIPLGATLGTILSALLDIPLQNATTISALCACLAAFIAAFCRSQRRSARKDQPCQNVNSLRTTERSGICERRFT